uniref:Family with sequence similarity 113 n=1 Tax=Gasterosteus aculeatus aculeatus TaxID=481459 RepID=A0AAQ4PVJ7_GASAC
MDITKCVSHQQASQLLHNKFVVVLGDSIQRSVYKDLVLLLQKETFLSTRQLKSKGEMCFEQDCLVEGGSFERMHNGTAYREVRQFRSAHHLVRFYFVTRVYSSYMQSFFEDLHNGLKPDVIIFNSCVWDISRYNSSWLENYKENLHTFFAELKRNVPQETLVIWNLTMPLGKRIQGGFLVPEFRFSLQHRTSDGVHWNAIAHRKITSLLLEHSAQAWGVAMPLAAVENTEVAAQWPTNENSTLTERHPLRRNYSYGGEFSNDCWPSDFLTNPQPNYLPQPPLGNGFDYRPPNRHHQQNVMRRQRVKLHYVPYAHPRYRH